MLTCIPKYIFIEEILYMFTHWTIKQTFLTFYLHLSPSQPFRVCVFLTMGVNTAVLVTNWLLAFLQCVPFLSILYPQNYPNSVCISTMVVMMVPPLVVSIPPACHTFTNSIDFDRSN